MGSDQIAEIAPGVREALDGGPGWVATFEVAGQPEKWVQLEGHTINASFPIEEFPEQILPTLPGFIVTEFEPGKFLTGRLDFGDVRSIAKWIDNYFINILGVSGDYSLDVTLSRM